MTTSLILQLGEIPPEGLHLEGELDRKVLEVPDQLAEATSPLRYALRVSYVDGYVVLQGKLSADFRLVCGQTSQRFDHAVVLDPYLESVEPENTAFLDLTDQLREDILLALPAYPRAPGSEAEVTLPPSEAQETRRSEWDALDGLKTND